MEKSKIWVTQHNEPFRKTAHYVTILGFCIKVLKRMSVGPTSILWKPGHRIKKKYCKKYCKYFSIDVLFDQKTIKSFSDNSLWSFHSKV